LQASFIYKKKIDSLKEISDGLFSSYINQIISRNSDLRELRLVWRNIFTFA